MKEATEQKVILKGFSADTFEMILKIIFESRNIITEANVFDVWHAADMLQMMPVTQLCKEYLRENINVNNCVKIYRNALLLSNKSLAGFSWKFILRSFSELLCLTSARIELLDMDFVEVNELVQDEFLKTNSEDDVIKFIFDWTNHDRNDVAATSDIPTPRTNHLHDLLMQCRLMVDSCSWSCLQDAVIKLSHMQDVDVERTKAVLTKCLAWKFKGHGKHNLSSRLSLNREGASNVDCYCNIYNRRSNRTGQMVISVGFSSMFDTTFRSILRRSIILGRFITATLKSDKVYIVVETPSSTFELFCLSMINESEPIKIDSGTLVTGPVVALTVLNNNLYLVGDVSKDGIVLAGSTHIHCIRPALLLAHLKVTTFGSTIVMFGLEVSGGQDFVTKIKCYDTEKDIHYQLDDIVGSPKYLCTFETLEDTFFLMSNGSLKKFAEDDIGKLKVYHIATLWAGRRHVFGALIINKTLEIAPEMPEDEELDWPKSSDLPNFGEAFDSISVISLGPHFSKVMPAVLPRSNFKNHHNP